MVRDLSLTARDRLLVLAPHPDDESLATGGLLQHARERGAHARIVFVTDGESNPWAQRVYERRLRIGDSDRRRFASHRRREAITALAVLGLEDPDVAFWHFPDQGLTSLLLQPSRELEACLDEQLGDFSPSVVAAPSPLDLHPDHSSLGVLIAGAVGQRGAGIGERLEYLIHNPRRSAPEWVSVRLPLSEDQRARKRAAILAHRTQMFWRRGWLLSFATGDETYRSATAPPSHPLAATRDADVIRIRLALRPRRRAFGAATLLVVAGRGPGAARLAVELPAGGGATTALDLVSGRRVAQLRLDGHPHDGRLELPVHLLPAGTAWLKAERRFGFFDEAGWLAVEEQARCC